MFFSTSFRAVMFIENIQFFTKMAQPGFKNPKDVRCGGLAPSTPQKARNVSPCWDRACHQ